jgi:hypothetical protein
VTSHFFFSTISFTTDQIGVVGREEASGVDRGEEEAENDEEIWQASANGKIATATTGN